MLSLQFNPNSEGARTATAGVLFQMQVSDSSHTTSTFELVSAPEGMTIDPNIGLVEWTPMVTDAGQTTVIVRNEYAGVTESTTTFETFFTAARQTCR